MYRSDADYVTGRRGRLELNPWITHPPFCVCAICPGHRQKAAEKSGRQIEQVWAEPFDIRARRLSPHPSNRRLSAAAALVLRTDEEKKLSEAVQKAEAERRARQTAVPFGQVLECYRAYLINGGHDYEHARSRIDNIEALIGPHRDTAAVDITMYRELLAEVALMSEETQRHYASMLLAMLNHAVSERVIASHQLLGVRVPQVKKEDEPEPWSPHELAVIMGPALDEYEHEQAAWNTLVAKDKANRGLRSPSRVPLRGLCLVAYFTMMRPKNNRALTWEEITIDEAAGKGSFRLDQHKNVNKGIKARGALSAPLLAYLTSIRPKNAHGLVHANPETGKPYVDIRKQWNRLIAIAGRLLGYELTGKKADFFNFRHTGASHVAAKSRDAAHLLGVVHMMGDTSLATVNRHYFNLADETLQAVVEGWTIEEIDLFEPRRLPLAS
jgi:integrase